MFLKHLLIKKSKEEILFCSESISQSTCRKSKYKNANKCSKSNFIKSLTNFLRIHLQLTSIGAMIIGNIIRGTLLHEVISH